MINEACSKSTHLLHQGLNKSDPRLYIWQHCLKFKSEPMDKKYCPKTVKNQCHIFIVRIYVPVVLCSELVFIGILKIYRFLDLFGSVYKCTR